MCRFLNSDPDRNCQLSTTKTPAMHYTCAEEDPSVNFIDYNTVAASPLSCTKCPADRDPVPDSYKQLASFNNYYITCVCKLGLYEDYTLQKCMPIHVSLDPTKVATSYYTGTCRPIKYSWSASLKRCMCTTGYYLDLSSDDCLACDTNCASC